MSETQRKEQIQEHMDGIQRRQILGCSVLAVVDSLDFDVTVFRIILLPVRRSIKWDFSVATSAC